MAKKWSRKENLPETSDLRIIGGRFRGRKLAYESHRSGNNKGVVTRPMKHRTREAIFNLVSTASKGRHAVDLFAGTGALGLEAISRGAIGCTFIEKHVPTARVVEQNIEALGVADCCSLAVTSAFLWARRDLPAAAARSSSAWLVFCSPPYAFYVDRQAEMHTLIEQLQRELPAESLLVVEADERFDYSPLQEAAAKGAWDIRTYSPAVVGVWQKE